MTDDIVERLLDPERGGGSDAYEAAKKIERLLNQVTQWQDLAADLEDRLEAALDDNGRLQELLRGVGANRYWEGRWRDETKEVERLTALHVAAAARAELAQIEIERLQAQLGQARGLLEDRAATIDRLLGARVIPGTNIPDAGTPSY